MHFATQVHTLISIYHQTHWQHTSSIDYPFSSLTFTTQIKNHDFLCMSRVAQSALQKEQQVMIHSA